MRRPFIVVIAAFSTIGVAGCGTPPPVTMPAKPSVSPPATAAAPPTQLPVATLPVTTVPVAETEPPASARLVLPDGGSGRFQELQITVVDITEKRTIDGDSMMRATLRLRTADKDETMSITSDEPKREWHGYELEYLGGWRKDVQLMIRRLSP